MDFRTFKNSTRGLWVGRGLVFIGGVITLCLVYFNGKHGWSLGRTWDEQAGLAILHGAVDPVTALLVSAAAIAMAWRYRWTGVVICAVAVVFTSYSVLTTAGFMSNRLIGVFSQKAALAELEKQGKWWNSATYRHDLTRGEQIANRAEIRATFKERVKVASQVPDPQAMMIAGVFGLQVETVQRVLNLISSGMGQTMKYMALLVGFFLLSNRDERAAEAASNQQNSGGPGGSNRSEPAKLKVVQPAPVPLRAAEPAKASNARVSLPGVPNQAAQLSAFDRALEVYLAHPNLSTRALAAISGTSQSTSVRVTKRQRGKINSIVRKYGNGGGFHSPAYN